MRRKIVFAKLFNQYVTYRDEWWFEIFRWMIGTGWNYRSDFPDGNGVYELLIGKQTCINCQECYDYFDKSHGFHDLDYIEKMRLVWIRAILSQDVSSFVKKWRKDNGIGFDKIRHLNLQIADTDTFKSLNGRLIDLLNPHGLHKKKLTVQLNQCWPQAVNIDSILLIVSKRIKETVGKPSPVGIALELKENDTEWLAILNYGFNESIWHHVLARQSEKPFADFLNDAHMELARLTEGKL
uniref:Uncharacterized protein n=1 Tax=viral metagenome TaxID=1070528 RepID=A0A6M3JPK7_9ZZZZ